MISALIAGLIVGAIAKLLMPGRDPGGFIITMIIGVVGAFLASFVGRTLGWYAEGAGAGWLASIAGAMLLLGIHRLVGLRGRTTTTAPR